MKGLSLKKTSCFMTIALSLSGLSFTETLTDRTLLEGGCPSMRLKRR